MPKSWCYRQQCQGTPVHLQYHHRKELGMAIHIWKPWLNFRGRIKNDPENQKLLFWVQLHVLFNPKQFPPTPFFCSILGWFFFTLLFLYFKLAQFLNQTPFQNQKLKHLVSKLTFNFFWNCFYSFVASKYVFSG